MEVTKLYNALKSCKISEDGSIKLDGFNFPCDPKNRALPDQLIGRKTVHSDLLKIMTDKTISGKWLTMILVGSTGSGKVTSLN